MKHFDFHKTSYVAISDREFAELASDLGRFYIPAVGIETTYTSAKNGKLCRAIIVPEEKESWF